jgi:hypothetical protein
VGCLRSPASLATVILGGILSFIFSEMTLMIWIEEFLADAYNLVNRDVSLRITIASVMACHNLKLTRPWQESRVKEEESRPSEDHENTRIFRAKRANNPNSL